MGKVIPTPGRAVAKIRCDVIREMMRMEMPDRWGDITDPPVGTPNTNTATYTVTLQKPVPGTDPTTWPVYYDVDPNKNPPNKTPSYPAFVTLQRPSSNQAYLARFAQGSQTQAFQQNPTLNQGAKCLYLLVAMGLDEPDVMENFSEGDIADVDHDGFKVFLDAWGRPITFLRWAPGIISPLQPLGPPDPGTTPTPPKDQRMPDQTDPTAVYGSPQPGSIAPGGKGRVYGNTFALYPLIYSAGPDGYLDVLSDSDRDASGNANPPWNYPSGTFLPTFFHSALTNPPNNPFASLTDSQHFKEGALGIATPLDSTATGAPPGYSDNITNHAMGAR
jgi:hypothetical protein